MTTPRIDANGNPRSVANRSLDLYGSKHTKLAKEFPALRDHHTWYTYWNPDVGRWLKKTGRVSVNHVSTPAAKLYAQAITSNEVPLPVGKIINAITQRLVSDKNKGYISGPLLFKNKAAAAQVFIDAMLAEEGNWLTGINTEQGDLIDEMLLPSSKSLRRIQLTTSLTHDVAIKDFFLEHVLKKLLPLLTEFHAIKLRIIYNTKMNNLAKGVMDDTAHLPGAVHEMLSAHDVRECVKKLNAEFHTAVDAFEGKGSGWTFSKLAGVTICVSKIKPPTGSSYVELPKWLAAKKAVVNIQNTDDLCFKWAVTSAIFPVDKDAQRVTKYKENSEKFDWSGITFPTKVSDITKFETRNSISINVYGTEQEKPVLIRRTAKVQEKHINLLLFDGHYCWIKNFNRFMSKDHTIARTTYYCESCGIGYTSQDLLAKHKEHECKPQFVEMPKEEKATVAFRNISHMLACPLVIYADFESALKPVNKGTAKTQVLQEHEAIAYAFQSVARDETLQNEFVMEVVEDAGLSFITSLRQRAANHYEFIHRNRKPAFTKEEWATYHAATVCHICCKSLNGDKVYDHNHTTGHLVGAAHSKCNIQRKVPDFVPVLFHNLIGYDGHYVFDAVARSVSNYSNISALPVTGEKFKSLDLKIEVGTYTDKDGAERTKYITYRFIDSMAFLSSGLSSLADNLPDNEKHFTRAAYPDETQFNIMKEKGFFPYDSVTCISDLQMTALPAFESMKSVMGDVNPADYARGVHAWKTFGCKTLEDYMKIYLKADVLLLSDVFESFRSMAIRSYRLDPCHYVSLPAMAWDAMLLKTGISLDLMTDADMYAMFEKGKRGGVSFIGHRHAKANNKYMPEYDSTKPSTYLQYYDANNLYGWAMCCPLPVGSYEWVSMTVDELLAADPNGEFGFECEAYFTYSRELHETHQFLPMLPENRKVDISELSDYQRELHDGTSTSKLISSLDDKEAYVCHFRVLQQAASMGLKVTKVGRVIRFKQSAWLAPYIEFNTSRRAQATNDFEKDFYKLMNNAVFGKTMEDVRGRMSFEFVNMADEERIVKMTSKPTYSGEWVELHQVAALKMNQRTVRLNKPIAVGVSILELSKVHMFNFHYNVMMPRYGPERIRLCMTDTDSLFYQIQTEDVYADVATMKEHFDCSDMDKSHPLFDTTNKKVLGKFKDEAKGKIITEFVGLRAKLYAYQYASGKVDKRCKGVGKRTVKDFTMENYTNTLRNGVSLSASMTTIQSKNHQLQTRRITKTAMSAYDDKRFLMDSVTSVPYGFNPLPK